ncbi:hypothetical protein PJE062_3799 [Pseudovibrio sp. JE062]|nr:hypothetical protein PJE062_3799 [Pseudovibrio sp. JE062]
MSRTPSATFKNYHRKYFYQLIKKLSFEVFFALDKYFHSNTFAKI